MSEVISEPHQSSLKTIPVQFKIFLPAINMLRLLISYCTLGLNFGQQ